ncbi:MAG: sugar transferase, partial [Actinomycetia bacterium]|nr:sugar transferase [Actinomycetes bacterium]
MRQGAGEPGGQAPWSHFSFGATPPPAPCRTGYLRVKRAGDLVFALALLLLLSWLLVLIAAAVLLVEGRPVLFVQQRPGRGGRLFSLYKFRTMSAAAQGSSAVQAAATDAARLTRLGRVLRAVGLDELPQLFNIVRGDLSFVGPRPLLPEYLPL